jgi:hypothetical protein
MGAERVQNVNYGVVESCVVKYIVNGRNHFIIYNILLSPAVGDPDAVRAGRGAQLG